MLIDGSRMFAGDPSRREFLKTSALAAGISLAGGLELALVRRRPAAMKITDRAGGLRRPRHRRGSAGAKTRANVRLVAMADAFKDALDESLHHIEKDPEFHELPAARAR